MRIALCDDEINSLTSVQEFVTGYGAEHEYIFDIFSYQNSMELLDMLEKGQHFDIYILDIVMPHVTGMSLAAGIRQYDERAVIIFLTSSPEFALESYDFSAQSYLLKPVTKDKFEAAMDRAVRSFKKQEKDCLLLHAGSKLMNVAIDSIEYVEVRRDKLIYYLNDGKELETYGTMSELENQLEGTKNFIKSHRSYLVNMDYICELDNQSIRMSGHFPNVPVSRSNYSSVKSSYLEYMVYMAGGKKL